MQLFSLESLLFFNGVIVEKIDYVNVTLQNDYDKENE